MSSKDDTKSACKDYNSLQYKTLIMTGNTFETNIVNSANETKLNSFLMQEMKEHKKQQWNKLTKTEKLKKANTFVDSVLKDEHTLSPSECIQTKRYLNMLIERKKLTKNSELTYNDETGIIEHIDLLLFNQSARKFTLNKEVKKKPAPKSKTVKKTKPLEESKTKIENEVKKDTTSNTNNE